jgi:RNA polymerase sigma-70 factor (ECF subfamily)
LAIQRFDAQYLLGLDTYVSRFRLGPDLLGELRQQARVTMLVGPAPLIGTYRGGGALAAWVRVIVVRRALALAEAARVPRQRMNDLAALAALAESELGPEANVIKARYHGALEEALKGALASLDDREKTLLRLHFLDGLNIDAIGRIYHVHRATVARWLVAVRRRVLDRVRSELRLPVYARSSELRSLVGLMRDELQLSLKRILG